MESGARRRLVLRGMATTDLDAYTARPRALDLRGIAWDDVPRHPLSADARRTLRYMQDIETHTIVYIRTLLSTRATDHPALARILADAAESVVSRPRSRMTFLQGAKARATALVARAWRDFAGVHMTWG